MATTQDNNDCSVPVFGSVPVVNEFVPVPPGCVPLGVVLQADCTHTCGEVMTLDDATNSDVYLGNFGVLRGKADVSKCRQIVGVEPCRHFVEKVGPDELVICGRSADSGPFVADMKGGLVTARPVPICDNCQVSFPRWLLVFCFFFFF